MRKPVLSSMAVAAVASLASAALNAQASGSMETGSLRTNAPAGGFSTKPNEVRSVIRTFAACSVQRRKGLTERYLAALADSEDRKRLFHQVINEECLGAGELTMRDYIIRGALFEALYLSDFGRRSPTDLSAAPPIDYAAALPEGASLAARADAETARFGDCVSRADAADARLLLLSSPDTAMESKAVAALAPHLGACVPQGQQARLSRSLLRGAVAEGLYRITRAASGRPWGTSQ